MTSGLPKQCSSCGGFCGSAPCQYGIIMTKDKTAPQRVAKYAQKMKDSGFVRVYLWARKDDAAKLREIARELREAKK